MHKKFQRLQNRALRITYANPTAETLEDLHIKARIAPINQRTDSQILCLLYRRSKNPNHYPQADNNYANTRSTK